MAGSKGVTPIVAMVLMLMIVIGLAGGFMAWMNTMRTGLENKSEEHIAHEIGKIMTDFRIVSVSGNKIWIRNSGTQPLDTTKLGIFVDKKRILPENYPTIDPGKTGALEFEEGITGNELKVAGSLKEKSLTPPAVAKWVSESENEIFANNNRCSPDLYRIENKNIQFFVSYSPVKDGPDVGTPCVTGDDPSYVGVPMRIWDIFSDSFDYRKNHGIIDNTHFYVNGNSFSLDNAAGFEEIEGGLKITYNMVGVLEPTATFTLSRNGNYTKISLNVKNTGTASETVQLKWDGDNDPPHGYYRDSDGDQCNCPPNHPDEVTGDFTSHEWGAFWPESTDDVYGVIVGNTDQEIKYKHWHGVRIRETSSTDIAPGESHTMTFYLTSNLRGPAGNEWGPVQNLYTRLSS